MVTSTLRKKEAESSLEISVILSASARSDVLRTLQALCIKTLLQCNIFNREKIRSFINSKTVT